jgi:hypothetical protein
MRPINWLDTTSRSIAARFPEIRERNANYITERLSILLLERLSSDLGEELIALLPENAIAQKMRSDFKQAASKFHQDRSIGYPDFIEVISRSFLENVAPSSQDIREYEHDYYEKIADAFLWAFAQEFSADLKWKLSQDLPLEIGSRMNLNSSVNEESRVA